MRSTAVVTLVAAGVVAGAGAAGYVLTRPAEPVQVQYVTPAASDAPASEPTPTGTPAAVPTATVTATPARTVQVAVPSTTTHPTAKKVTVPKPTSSKADSDVTVTVVPGEPPPVIYGDNDKSLAPTPTATK